MKNNETANKILERIAKDYGKSPRHICEILDGIISRAWKERDCSEELWLGLFSEKPAAEEFLAAVFAE